METHRFAQYLTNCGAVSEEDVYAALNHQSKNRPTIGQVALMDMRLTVKQVMRILFLQAGTVDLFGEAAIKHGFLSEKDVQKLLEKQDTLQQRIGEILVEMGKIKNEDLDRLLHSYHEALEKTHAA